MEGLFQLPVLQLVGPCSPLGNEFGKLEKPGEIRDFPSDHSRIDAALETSIQREGNWDGKQEGEGNSDISWHLQLFPLESPPSLSWFSFRLRRISGTNLFHPLGAEILEFLSSCCKIPGSKPGNGNGVIPGCVLVEVRSGVVRLGWMWPQEVPQSQKSREWRVLPIPKILGWILGYCRECEAAGSAATSQKSRAWRIFPGSEILAIPENVKPLGFFTILKKLGMEGFSELPHLWHSCRNP